MDQEYREKKKGGIFRVPRTERSKERQRRDLRVTRMDRSKERQEEICESLDIDS